VCVYCTCRVALCVYRTVYIGILCVLHSVEALFPYCTVYNGTVCVLQSVERHSACTAKSREALCVYSTV